MDIYPNYLFPYENLTDDTPGNSFEPEGFTDVSRDNRFQPEGFTDVSRDNSFEPETLVDMSGNNRFQSEKLENSLQLALDTPQAEREASASLNTGFNEADKTWELIVKYNNSPNFLSYVNSRQIQTDLLLSGYAILTIPESEIPALTRQPFLEFVEQPKRLFFADRAGLPNDIGADLFVSIHNNSYPAAASVNGTAVLYDEKKETEGNSSKHLADILLKKTTEALGTKNMGLVAGNDIYVIRSCEAPAALVEVGFMTNPKELANLTDKNYQKKCARAIYEGILQALEEGY